MTINCDIYEDLKNGGVYLDFYDLSLNTQVLCSLSLRNNDTSIHLLCGFFESLPDDKKVSFNKCAEMFWEERKYRNRKSRMISQNAIRLAIKIQTDLGLVVFPSIEKIATKSWSVADGTYSWGMQCLDDENFLRSVYGWQPASMCIQKKYVLETSIDNRSLLITAEYKYKEGIPKLGKKSIEEAESTNDSRN